MRGKAETTIDDKLIKELRAALAYDPATSGFRRLIDRGGRRKIGTRADHLDRTSRYWFVRFRDSQGVDHRFRAHRLAWLFIHDELPKEIDHIDRDRTNNVPSNLREVTRSQNKFNCSLRSNNTSGKTGVYFDPRYRKPWCAKLRLNYRMIVIGHFATCEAAVVARKAAELEYLGRLCPS